MTNALPKLLPGSQLIGIDPGVSGGIAWARLNENMTANLVQAVKMPKSPDNPQKALEDLFNVLELITKGYHTVCYLENVGFYRPGNSAVSAVKFGKHVGHLQMALVALKIDTVKIVPSKWMKGVLIEVPKEKGTRKHEIKELMQKMYPEIKVTLALSDALGILTYAFHVEKEDHPILFE